MKYFRTHLRVNFPLDESVLFFWTFNFPAAITFFSTGGFPTTHALIPWVVSPFCFPFSAFALAFILFFTEVEHGSGKVFVNNLFGC